MQGQQITTDLRPNDYALVLQADIAGEGFAFDWQHVTRSLLEQGLLVAREDWSWRTGLGFYLVWSKQKPLSPQAEQVRDWIIELAASDLKSPPASTSATACVTVALF